MSDVKRYGFRKDPMADCYCDMEETDRGGYVTEEDYESLRSRLAEAEAALRRIAEFGKRNSGCGYSCARMAEEALSTADSASASLLPCTCQTVCGLKHGERGAFGFYCKGQPSEDAPEKCLDCGKTIDLCGCAL